MNDQWIWIIKIQFVELKFSFFCFHLVRGVRNSRINVVVVVKNTHFSITLVLETWKMHHHIHFYPFRCRYTNTISPNPFKHYQTNRQIDCMNNPLTQTPKYVIPIHYVIFYYLPLLCTKDELSTKNCHLFCFIFFSPSFFIAPITHHSSLISTLYIMLSSNCPHLRIKIY